MMKENGKIIRCPVCGSTNVEAVMPFDYIKMCNNNKCKYYLEHPKKYRYQFFTECHN